MSVLYVLIPISFFMAVTAFFAFAWSVKSGQLDDLSGDGTRALVDNSDEHINFGGEQ